MGSLQSQLHLYPEAIKTYQAAIRINPNNALFYRFLSQNLAAINDPKQALKMINQALELDPINFEYIYSKETLSQWVERIQHEERPIITGKSYIAPRPLSVFEQYLATANQEASLKHYHKAALAMQKAIRQKPRDSLLYKKISEIYAMEQQPKLALSAINQAVKLEPKNIAYLRTRGELAGWAMDKTQLQDSYARILKLKPYDEDAMLQLAHAFAWQGQTDKAISAYVALLKLYPNNAEGWIEYAEALSWTGNYVGTLSALENYKHLKGETKVYCQTKARALALTGYFNSACAINEPLLKSYPNDPYILSTEITALIESFHLAKAIKVLEKLDNILIKENQVNALKKNTLIPLKSNVNLEVDYASASDTTRILDVPVYGQYFFNPTTSLLLQGLYERAGAFVGSGLEATNGHSYISDESGKIGFTKQISGYNLKGLVGALKIQGKNNHGIYDVLMNTNLTQKAQITLENSQDLFRPYLIPQTPRLISLQVIENRTSAYLQWQPYVQKYFDIVASQSSLSDNNSYTHVNVWPRQRVYNSERWQVTLGVDADIWAFRRRAMDGYYSPLLFNGYEGTVQLYYAQSENIGYSLWGGFGMQKDELFPHYFYEEDLGMQLFFGIYKDLELKIKGGYTLRDNPSHHNYQFWSGGAVLTKRF